MPIRRSTVAWLALAAGSGCGGGRGPAACDAACGVPAGEGPSLSITVDQIPESMNGSEAFTGLDQELHEFVLALPLDGFTLDLVALPGDDAVDFDTLSVTCDGGENLAGFFQATAAKGGRRFRVDPAHAFAVTAGDPVACTAAVNDAAGRPAVSMVTFTVVAPTPQLLPFDSPDTWVLDFSRDRFSVTGGPDPGTGAYTVFSAEGANGIPEYTEELGVIGFRGTETAAGAATLESAGQTGVNAIVARRLRQAVLARVRGFYHQAPDGTRDEDGVPLDLVLADDAGAPDLSTFARDGTFSIMGIGGEGLPEDRLTFFGKSELDPRNEVRNDDSVYGLGVFTTTALRALLAQPAAASVVAPFIPALGGVTIGDDPADPVFLADGFDAGAPGVDPTVADRAAKFGFAFDQLVKALGALTAHEIAHSLGLVADGPPPTGLFGGEKYAEFADPLTTPAHLDVEGMNLMAAGGGGAGLGSGLAGISEEPFFTPLELAYFRGRLWVLP
jgi:hypothetical protein